MNWMEEEERPARAIWLITLADLSLLLVGFFVLLQATQVDGGTLAAGIRSAFVEESEPAMPVELAVAGGFDIGSAQPGPVTAAVAWAHAAAHDTRTTLVVTGEVDGSSQDVDAATGSGPILASDRARAVAALLVRSGAVSPARIQITTRTGQRRAVLTLGYDGGRQ